MKREFSNFRIFLYILIGLLIGVALTSFYFYYVQKDVSLSAQRGAPINLEDCIEWAISKVEACLARQPLEKNTFCAELADGLVNYCFGT